MADKNPLNSQIQKMSVGRKVSISSKDLESLLKKKTKELIEANTDIAQLQQACDQLKEDVLLWKTKSDNLAQRCTKLASLLRKYFAENGTPSQSEKNKTKATSLTSTEPSLKRNLVSTAESEVSPLQKKHKETPSDIKNIKKEDKHNCNKTEPETLVSKTAEVPEVIPSLPVEPTGNDNQPKPSLTVSQTEKGLEVTWNHTDTENFSNSQIKQYELFAFNNSLQAWKKVGEIKTRKLPIKVTLAQSLKPGSSYYFAVRARCLDDSAGPFSDIQKICLK